MLDTGWRPKVLARINKSQDDLRLFLVVEDQETNSIMRFENIDIGPIFWGEIVYF